MKRSLIVGAGLCAVLISATACSSEGGIYAVPLPGGPDVGSDPMHLTIQFDDVLDLVPQSAVKVDGVPVGRVDDVSVGPDGWTADVGIILDSSVDLPANAIAAVEQTNLLGEKFIQLSAPRRPDRTLRSWPTVTSFRWIALATPRRSSRFSAHCRCC